MVQARGVEGCSAAHAAAARMLSSRVMPHTVSAMHGLPSAPHRQPVWTVVLRHCQPSAACADFAASRSGSCSQAQPALRLADAQPTANQTTSMISPVSRPLCISTPGHQSCHSMMHALALSEQQLVPADACNTCVLHAASAPWFPLMHEHRTTSAELYGA